MKIIKNKPLPKSRSKYATLLEMEIGDCVEFSVKSDFVAATGFLRQHFKIITKQRLGMIKISKELFGELKEKQNDT